MKNQYTRQITTGLTGSTNKAILESIMGQLSDGKWENSPAMVKYWDHSEIEEMTGGELVIMIDDGFGSGWTAMNGDAIRAKFAGWLKAIVYEEMDDGYGNFSWKRDMTTELSYLGRNYGQSPAIVTIADAYRAYDILKGRDIRIPNPAKIARQAAIASKQAEIAAAEAVVAKLKAQLAKL